MVTGITTKCFPKGKVSIPTIEQSKKYIISPEKTNPITNARRTADDLEVLLPEDIKNSEIYKFLKDVMFPKNNPCKAESGGGCNIV